MTGRAALLGSAFAVLVGGCAAQQTYDWGKYDPSLYAYYRDPTKEAELESSLAEIIQTGGTKGKAVPPGIYAEYGYLQLQHGKTQEAIESFKQEEAHWPESKVFMERMIKVAGTPGSASKGAGTKP